MSLSVDVYACINAADKVDLTSNWCVTTPVNVKIHSTCPKFFGHRSEVSPALPRRGVARRGNLTSVPMARRKHLFSSRTQKLSSSAAIILPKVGN